MSAPATPAFRIVPFEALSGADVYDVLALRQRIFVVEQRCCYLDADGLDAAAEHLLARDGDGRLVAYLRILPPGVRLPEIAIGRVVVTAERRGEALGRRVMEAALAHVDARGRAVVMLAAQAHLEGFYGSLGFVRVSDEYDEDGIPHVDMRR